MKKPCLWVLLSLVLAFTRNLSAEQMPREGRVQQVITNASFPLYGASLNSSAVPEVGQITNQNTHCPSHCNIPDPLAPYRKLFDDARPLKLSDIQDQELLLVNLDEAPAIKDGPYSGSGIYFNLKGVLPRVSVYYLISKSACDEQPKWCSLQNASLYETDPLITEGGELKSYYKIYRYSYHIKDDYIFVKTENCEDGKNWQELGYYFASIKKHKREN